MIYCGNFCKCHNVPQYSNNMVIKKGVRKKQDNEKNRPSSWRIPCTVWPFRPQPLFGSLPCSLKDCPNLVPKQEDEAAWGAWCFPGPWRVFPVLYIQHNSVKSGGLLSSPPLYRWTNRLGKIKPLSQCHRAVKGNIYYSNPSLLDSRPCSLKLT
jgi:hypothetical protein